MNNTMKVEGFFFNWVLNYFCLTTTSVQEAFSFHFSFSPKCLFMYLSASFYIFSFDLIQSKQSHRPILFITVTNIFVRKSSYKMPNVPPRRWYYQKVGTLSINVVGRNNKLLKKKWKDVVVVSLSCFCFCFVFDINGTWWGVVRFLLCQLTG